ncbi:hypothetical protein [Halocatena pleomorpha]|uniref:Uncharacterized protein n=1 Tax=Halocatena pleomorpha TaxID=1785090 RepID=A0A3P3RJG4_9EURY|nr:hypothetical protein [Halocatena pleomorpha]RRJ33676.1 hypothetical protein EIK79_02450 [Halocatena pleomorpha]
MIGSDVPYVYDRFDDTEISDAPVPVSETSAGMGHETVITNGVAMSFRSYQRRKRDGYVTFE